MTLQRFSGGLVLAGVVLWLVNPAAPAPRETGGTPLRETGTVTIAGLAGTFGENRDTLPSGQRLGRVEVPGWGFPAARKPGRSVLASDGTVLTAAMSHTGDISAPTSAEMAISAYDPASNTSSIVRLTSSTGRTTTVNAKGLTVAGTVTDMVALPGGAVAFVAWTTDLVRDPAGQGAWPAFGVLTKVDGHWQALPQNVWTAETLGKDLDRLMRIVRLPSSGDLIVAQRQGGLTALRLTGPDAAGLYSVKVKGSLALGTDVTAHDLHADPTGKPGEERFVAGLEHPKQALSVIQEFGYDSRGSQLRRVSAAMVPGDISAVKRAYGYQMAVYDRTGNLWAARRDGDDGGKLAVYTAARCPVAGTSWAHKCPPQYNVVQAKEFRQPRGLATDPATGAVVLLAERGVLLSARLARWENREPVFEVGNPVDVGRKLLTYGENNLMDTLPGAVDGAHRLWFPVSRLRFGHGSPDIDHWVMSVNLDDLFNPWPVRLPSIPGRSTTIQAESTTTTDTRIFNQTDVISRAYFGECTDGAGAVACGNDRSSGNGFYLLDSTHFGFMAGSLDYLIEVPVAGGYQFAYHVATFPVTTDAKIELVIGRNHYVTLVSTLGDWRPMRVGEVVMLEAGAYVITLFPPPGATGWFLNSVTVQRV